MTLRPAWYCCEFRRVYNALKAAILFWRHPLSIVLFMVLDSGPCAAGFLLYLGVAWADGATRLLPRICIAANTAGT